MIAKYHTIGFSYRKEHHKSQNSKFIKMVVSVYFMFEFLLLILCNLRKHVWTYAAGLSDDYNYLQYNCPCAATPGPDQLEHGIYMGRSRGRRLNPLVDL